jgi:hypothetical protein
MRTDRDKEHRPPGEHLGSQGRTWSECSVAATLVHAPDGSGTKLAAMVACYCGSLAEGETATRPLKRFGSPVMEQVDRHARAAKRRIPAHDLAYQPILGRRLGSSGLAGQGAGDAPVLKNNQRKSNSRG